MVLSILCNDDKYVEKDCPSFFGINVSQSIIVSPNFLSLLNKAPRVPKSVSALNDWVLKSQSTLSA